MNKLLIDLQVANFINTWRWLDRGAIGKCAEFNILRKIKDEEFDVAYEIAKKKYMAVKK